MPFEVTFMRLNLPLWRAMATSSTNCGCKVGSPMPCRVTKPVGGQPPRIRWNSCRSICWSTQLSFAMPMVRGQPAHLRLHSVVISMVSFWIALGAAKRFIMRLLDRLFWRGPLEVGGLYRSEEHTSELPSLMRISYAVFCLKKKTTVE